MTYLESDETAADYAEQALELMRQHGVAPNPRNFEIWYNYVSGDIPALRRGIDTLVDNGEKFSTERTDALYAEYFPVLNEELHVAEATAKLEAELTKLVEAFGAADGNTHAFGKALAAFTVALQDGNESGLKTAVGNIVGATTDMRRRNRALETQLDESLGEIKQLHTDLDAMRKEAFTDALTAVANRKMFDLELQRLSTEATLDACDLSLLMLDIDHFKRFNDTYGHQIGDQVLRLLAATVKECVKGRDIPARYGGEEFAVILPNTRLDDALVLAEQVRRAIGGKKVINKLSGEDLGRITVSIGAGQLVAGEAPENLVRRADAALYFAKHGGRNRVASELDIGQTSLSITAETG